jgi:hypothetical protein
MGSYIQNDYNSQKPQKKALNMRVCVILIQKTPAKNGITLLILYMLKCTFQNCFYL